LTKRQARQSRQIRPLCGLWAQGFGILLQAVGELDRKIDAFADLAGGLRFHRGVPSRAVKCLEEPIEILSHQLLAERRVAAGPREIALGYQLAHDLKPNPSPFER
jgi:hypothetical protein